MVRLFHYLSLLNMVDAFITFYGLETAVIEELNPIMAKAYETHPALFILIKLTLSLSLYFFILFKMIPTSRFIRNFAFVASFLYTIVFGLHCWWLFLNIG